MAQNSTLAGPNIRATAIASRIMLPKRNTFFEFSKHHRSSDLLLLSTNRTTIRREISETPLGTRIAKTCLCFTNFYRRGLFPNAKVTALADPFLRISRAEHDVQRDFRLGADFA